MEKKNTHTYINTYVFFSMTEKGASGNENEKKKQLFIFFPRTFFPNIPKSGQILKFLIASIWLEL